MNNSPHGRSGARLTTTVAGVVAGFIAAALLALIGIQVLGRSGDAADRQATSTQPVARSSAANIPVPDVSDAVRTALPEASTHTTVKNAPVDLSTTSNGTVIKISEATVAFAEPGATPVTVIPRQQIGRDTWLPVLARRANWLQVRLPARPNGVTAWIPSIGQRTATTAWRVRIDLSAETITVSKGDQPMGTWEIGKGQDGTPTPQGETFLLAGFVDPQQDFSPVIYALGVHSDTLDTYGGGPGTVAVHGWPDRAGRIGKVSHGCVRVPDAALTMFGKLPAGTPVSITA